MAIYLNNPEAFTEVLTKAQNDSPRKGKRVIVHFSRKHHGKQGIVFWHGVDKYHKTREVNFLQSALHDACGTIGFRIGVVTDDGERFFVKADDVAII